MAKKLYVGNLSYNTHEEDLREAFSKIGEVLSATLIVDQTNGRSKGFGFVEMASDEDAEKAITAMNGTSFMGRRPKAGVRDPAAGAVIAAAVAATAAEGVGLGGKSPVPGHRKGAAEPEKETPARRSFRGTEEAALLRKALGEKKEEAAGGSEAKEEASQALTAIRVCAEAGKQQRSKPAQSNNLSRTSRYQNLLTGLQDKI
jgi:cold-inducible RNA-binding protein